MKKLTREEKFEEREKLISTEFAEKMQIREDKIEESIIKEFGKKMKYRLIEIQSNQSIREGKTGEHYEIVTTKGKISINL
jgi:hypothetical protein